MPTKVYSAEETALLSKNCLKFRSWIFVTGLPNTVAWEGYPKSKISYQKFLIQIIKISCCILWQANKYCLLSFPTYCIFLICLCDNNTNWHNKYYMPGNRFTDFPIIFLRQCREKYRLQRRSFRVQNGSYCVLRTQHLSDVHSLNNMSFRDENTRYTDRTKVTTGLKSGSFWKTTDCFLRNFNGRLSELERFSL